MAYAYDPNLSEEENRRKEQDENAASVAASAGLVGSGGAPSAGASPTTATGPSASGSFTNLQRYLTENQPQAQALAEKVSSQVSGAGEEARGAVQQVEQDFQRRVDAARVRPDVDVVEAAAADPRAVSGDAGRRAAFIRQRDASYTGPRDLSEGEGYETAAEKVRRAQERAGLADTEAGRMELLKSVSAPGAGRGKLTLDQLLLAGAPGTRETLASAAQPFAALQEYLSGRGEAARGTSAEAAAEAEAARRAVAQRFTGSSGAVVPQLQTKIEKQAQEAAAARDRHNALVQEISDAYDNDNVPSQAALDAIDMTAEDFENARNMAKHPQNYTQNGQNIMSPRAKFNRGAPIENVPTQYNTLTQEELAQILALEDLLGTGFSYIPKEYRDQAGTYSGTGGKLPSFTFTPGLA